MSTALTFCPYISVSTYLIIHSVEDSGHRRKHSRFQCVQVVGQPTNVSLEKADPCSMDYHHSLSAKREWVMRDAEEENLRVSHYREVAGIQIYLKQRVTKGTKRSYLCYSLKHMSQRQEGYVDITGTKRIPTLKQVHTHAKEHMDTQVHIHTRTEGERKTSVMMCVPPPPSQTCGPEAEKTSSHPPRWSEGMTGEKSKRVYQSPSLYILRHVGGFSLTPSDFHSLSSILYCSFKKKKARSHCFNLAFSIYSLSYPSCAPGGHSAVLLAIHLQLLAEQYHTRRSVYTQNNVVSPSASTSL